MAILIPTFVKDLEAYCTDMAAKWVGDSLWKTCSQEKVAAFTSFLYREGLCFTVAFAVAREIDKRAEALLESREPPRKS